MEDVSRVIEIAVGIILFIIAVTIAILTYSKLSKAAENSLSINNMESDVIYNSDEINEQIYTKQDIYFLLNDIVRQSDETQVDEDNNIYKELINVDTLVINNQTSRISINKNTISSVIQNATAFNSRFTSEKYKIEYVYKYVETDNSNLNGHLPTKIIFTSI